MISERLKLARKNSNLTQGEVAKKLYVTRQTISRWEQGKTLPNIFAIEKLSDIYQVSLDELIKDTLLEKKEAKNMKDVNYFALFGAIIFNLFLFSMGLIFSVGMLILIFGISLVMILSPILFGIFVASGIQEFSFIQLGLTIFFLIIGIFSLPLIKKVSVMLLGFLRGYLKYNHKSIFY
ncbi:helix-turn-helix domain-containing protein [Staphylococcus hominis]|uniref:helix-turn-helix domain-containing protein n=1 Tax=Staphylococcus hominis TaxID=1290 RepID=UPI002DD6B279|nr:helix-turn-helix domain-containing protein [Staphylococcus hominis]WRY66961.1 helix-turn-helix domain-containing protein [Staphylococcus hominis]